MASLVQLKPIIPKKYKGLDLDAITRKVVASEMAEVREDYERTTKSWDEQPTFIIKFDADRLGGTVSTSNKIYHYVDAGTKPHIIKPKRPGYPLRFNVPFKPKTSVMQIKSGAGSRGNTTVRAMVVHHPGTKARKFTQVIQRAHNRAFKRKLEQEIQRQASRQEG